MANKNKPTGFPGPQSLARMNQAMQADRIDMEMKTFRRDTGTSPTPCFFSHSISPNRWLTPSEGRKCVLSVPREASCSAVQPSIIRPIPLPPQSAMFIPVQDKEVFSLSDPLGSSTSTSHYRKDVTILQLPGEVLQKILMGLSYAEVAKTREVCTMFNRVGQGILNNGFRSISDGIAAHLKVLQASMPRRGSLRRKHALAQTADYTDSLSTRFHLFQMVFGRYLQRENCCFFAGSVLDDAARILTLLETNSAKCLVTYEMIDDFHDLCGMAVEYFKDNVECGWYSPCTVNSFSENDSNMDDCDTDIVIDEREMYDDVVCLKKGVSKNGRIIRRNQKSVMSTINSMKKEMRALRAHSVYMDRVMKRQSRELKKARLEVRRLKNEHNTALAALKEHRSQAQADNTSDAVNYLS